MIRSTKHSLKFSNSQKLETIGTFIDEYRRVTSLILRDIWANGYKDFSIQEQKYTLPKYLDYNDFDIDTVLSARALSSLVTQLSGNIRACVAKQSKRIYQYSLTPNKHLLKSIKEFSTSCPSVEYLNPELSSKCVDMELTPNGEFYGFMRLKSLGKEFGHIKIPIQLHKVNKKYKDWNLKNSFLICKNNIQLRWEKEIGIKADGNIVGADQGLTTCLTLSDGQITKKDVHGHDLSSICDKLSRKRKGSKQFNRAQTHRNNYVNWSINQLNFDNIKQINVEKIHDLNRGRNTSRKLKHFSYPLIRKALISRAELCGVHIIEQESAFKSQRCSECGWVQKKNRKAKEFSCCICKHSMDADLNASKNHEINLPTAFHLIKSKMNISGFYMMPDGFYDRFGQELRVSASLVEL